MLVTGGIALAGVPTGAPLQAKGGGASPPSAPGGQGANVAVLQGHLTPSSNKGNASGKARITAVGQPDSIVDLAKLGIHPIQGAPASRPQPATGSIGTVGTYMVGSPDVISQTAQAAAGYVLSGFTPGETVNVTANGVALLAGPADANDACSLASTPVPALATSSSRVLVRPAVTAPARPPRYWMPHRPCPATRPAPSVNDDRHRHLNAYGWRSPPMHRLHVRNGAPPGHC